MKLRIFVIEYFTNEYADEGGLLECLLAYDYGGLGGLCPSGHQDWVDDTSDEFLKNYNQTVQDQI